MKKKKMKALVNALRVKIVVSLRNNLLNNCHCNLNQNKLINLPLKIIILLLNQEDHPQKYLQNLNKNLNKIHLSNQANIVDLKSIVFYLNKN